MINWPPGQDVGPDGSPVREIPQRHVWASSVWITEDGIAWRRFFNLATKHWVWDDRPLPITIEGNQDGITLEWFTSVDRAIAIAWLYRHPESTGHVHRRTCVHLVNGRESPPAPEPRLQSLSWDRDEAPDNEPPPENESWRPLRWHVGAVQCDSKYNISSTGRLRSPSGHITRGFWYDGRRWAAVRNAGLVDLWTAAGIHQTERIQPAIRNATAALMAGNTPKELTQATGIAHTTAWSYLCRAAERVPGTDLRRLAPALVGRSLWNTLVSIRTDPAVGDTLKTLMGALHARRAAPEGEFIWERLRFARLCLLAP